MRHKQPNDKAVVTLKRLTRGMTRKELTMKTYKRFFAIIEVLLLIFSAGCTTPQNDFSTPSEFSSFGVDDSEDFLPASDSSDKNSETPIEKSDASSIASDNNSQTPTEKSKNTQVSPSNSKTPSEFSDNIEKKTGIFLTPSEKQNFLIPTYNNNSYTIINNNIPVFSEVTTTSFEYYSELDDLGRCGACYACIGSDLMPTQKRGSIGMIKPTGWHTVKYESVDGKYLYNRCHLIGYQLTAENANEKNLITGTRYLNTEGMLPFENLVADYIKETGNHVMYRVVPIFTGNNLVADGVTMEGFSVEDDGAGVSFAVYCYNVQPDIIIDYATGDSHLAEAASSLTEESVSEKNNYTESTENKPSPDISAEYILNTNTKKFHLPTCSSAKRIADKNRETFSGSRDDLISQGYLPCKKCNP